MASNPYVNKVEFNGQTVVDLTGDTAEAGDVISGKKFHLKNGAQATGSLSEATQSTAGLMSAADKTKLDGIESGANKTTVVDALDSTSETSALSAKQGKKLNDDKLNTSDIQMKSGGNNWWEATPNKIPHYFKYEGSNTTTYKLPIANCIIMVIKESASRGVAWAIRWSNGVAGEMWIAHLHDDTSQSQFSAWEKIITKTDLNPFTTAKSWSDGSKPTFVNGSDYGNNTYYFKVGCFCYLIVSAQFSSAPSNTKAFTLPAGYRPIGDADISVSGGGSYNAKAQCIVKSSGDVYVTSVDKWVIGSGMFLIGG